MAAPAKSVQPSEAEGWARTEIDAFILAGLEKANLRPVKDADRATLIRRIAYDLTGLPPTPDEVKDFLADTSPDAVKRVIDMYLDSRRFGERWGRHWLDISRYAESSGKEVNVLYPHAWRYRDYVVESFNQDKPYDQFLKEQLAGDLMKFNNKHDQAEKIVATGFLAIGSKGHNNRDKRQFAGEIAAQIAAAIQCGADIAPRRFDARPRIAQHDGEVGQGKGVGAGRIAKLVERPERQAIIDEAAIEPNALGADFGHIGARPAIAEQHLDLLRGQIGIFGIADYDIR